MDDLDGPAAPKRRRVVARADRLAAFATAAQHEGRHGGGNELQGRRTARPRAIASPCDAVLTIQATWRGHSTRAMVARTRPSSAPSSEEGAPPASPSTGVSPSAEDEIPEEIEGADDDDRAETKDSAVTALALHMAAALTSAEDGFDSALEHSGELESSGELAALSATEHAAAAATPPELERRASYASTRTCAICLGDMAHRRQPPTDLFGPAPLSVAKLDCSHRFHRRCLLSWCRQRGRLAECPLCRTAVSVRRRFRAAAPEPALGQHPSVER